MLLHSHSRLNVTISAMGWKGRRGGLCWSGGLESLCRKWKQPKRKPSQDLVKVEKKAWLFQVGAVAST